MSGLVGAGFAFLSALMFAITNVLIRRGIPSRSTRAGLVLMTVINVAVLLTLLGVLTLVNGMPHGDWSGIAWFAAAGIAGPLIGQSTLMGSIARIGAAQGGAVKNIAPAITVGMAFLLIGETLSPFAVAGMLLVFGGLGLLMAGVWREGERDPAVTILTAGSSSGTPPIGAPAMPQAAQPTAAAAPEREDPGRRKLVGLLLGLAAAFGFGTSQMLRKVGMVELPNAVLGAAISSLSALVVVLALRRASMFGTGGHVPLRAQFNYWMAFAGVTSSLGQVSFYLALDTVEVSRVALIVSSDIVLTMILAALVLGDDARVSKTVVAAAALVFSGVIAVSLG